MACAWPTERPVLADDDVLLRAWRPDDVDSIYHACQDPDIQHFTRVPVPYLRDHAVHFVTLSERQWAEQQSAGFAVTDASTGELVGACGLLGIDHQARRAGVGYWVAPWARGRGVATSALRLVTEWALGDGGMRCVYVEVEEDNVASTAVARAAGFVRADLPVEVVELKGTARRFATYERSGP